MATTPIKLALRDIHHIAGRSSDDRVIEILLSAEALTKLEAFIAQANLEIAKHQPRH